MDHWHNGSDDSTQGLEHRKRRRTKHAVKCLVMTLYHMSPVHKQNNYNNMKYLA